MPLDVLFPNNILLRDLSNDVAKSCTNLRKYLTIPMNDLTSRTHMGTNHSVMIAIFVRTDGYTCFRDTCSK